MRRLLKTSSIGTAPAKNLAMQGDSVSDGQAAKANDRAAATCLKGIKTIIIHSIFFLAFLFPGKVRE